MKNQHVARNIQSGTVVAVGETLDDVLEVMKKSNIGKKSVIVDLLRNLPTKLSNSSL